MENNNKNKDMDTQTNDFKKRLAEKKKKWIMNTSDIGQSSSLQSKNLVVFNNKKHLNKSGFIAFEIGIGQAKQIHELLEKDFEKIIVKKDVSGIERVVVARLKD